jgi:hypothetical protein
MKKLTRDLNGYIAVYRPEHPNAYTSENWKGWIYEHRLVAEALLGRSLRDDERVHHLDCDKHNNRDDNIVVLASNACHMRLHNWINAGGNVVDSYEKRKITNFGKPKPICKMCDNVVAEHDAVYCSILCSAKDQRTTERPSKEDLIRMVKDMGYSEVGRLYNVSDNAIRKWMKAYKVNHKTFEDL